MKQIKSFHSGHKGSKTSLNGSKDSTGHESPFKEDNDIT